MGNKNKGFGKQIKKILREDVGLKTVINDKGNEIIINPLKHFLLQKQYKCDKNKEELLTIIKQYTEYLKTLNKGEQT
jgi:hypothetical protein